MNSIILGSSKWSELFEKHDFFHKYRYFLQIIASTASAEAQLMWYAFPDAYLYQRLTKCRAPNVEAKIRQLVSKLELVESLTLAHPFTKGFEQVFYCMNDDEIRSVAQGEVPDIIARRRPQDIEGVESGSKVYSTTFYIGLAIEPRPGALPVVMVRCVRRLTWVLQWARLGREDWTSRILLPSSPRWRRCGSGSTRRPWVSSYGISKGRSLAACDVVI